MTKFFATTVLLKEIEHGFPNFARYIEKFPLKSDTEWTVPTPLS